MAGDDLIEMEGEVTEVFPGGTFEVTIQQGEREHKVHTPLRAACGLRIRVVLEDRVTVGVSPTTCKGRITYRHK